MKVSVVGLGYVGSVAAAGLAANGHDVLGIDVDREKTENYRQGLCSSYEPGLAELVRSGLESGRLRFLHTDEVSEPLGEVILVTTGTPTSQSGGADLSYVKSALVWTKARQPEGGLIVMKSTVPPGTGAKLLATHFQDTPFGYVSNPEFLREGQAVQDWFYPDRVVVGADRGEDIEKMKGLYQGIETPYVVTDITSAEMIKYAANAFLATKVSFINEIATLCDRIGGSIDEVTRGISLDPRVGPSFLKAGVGYGGSCFPKDTRALDDLALHNGHNFELLRSVITVNNRQRLLPLYALRQHFDRLMGLKIGVLGLAFKPNTNDVREAPAINLIHTLHEEGAFISAYDPSAMESAARVLPESVCMADDPASCAWDAQALVLMTEWPEIVRADWQRIAEVSKSPRFLFDGRNALEPAEMTRLGFQYCGVGRGVAHSAARSE